MVSEFIADIQSLLTEASYSVKDAEKAHPEEHALSKAAFAASKSASSPEEHKATAELHRKARKAQDELAGFYRRSEDPDRAQRHTDIANRHLRAAPHHSKKAGA